MNNDAIILIVSAEAENACKDEPDFIERITKAMTTAKGNWMTTNPDEQLKGALNAALKTSSGDEYDHLEKSIKRMGEAHALLAALTSGIPVDYEALEKKNEELENDGFEPVPIMELWNAA